MGYDFSTSAVLMDDGDEKIDISLEKDTLLTMLILLTDKVSAGDRVMEAEYKHSPIILHAVRSYQLYLSKLLIALADAVGPDVLEGLGAGIMATGDGEGLSFRRVEGEFRERMEREIEVGCQPGDELVPECMMWVIKNKEHAHEDSDIGRELRATADFIDSVIG